MVEPSVFVAAQQRRPPVATPVQQEEIRPAVTVEIARRYTDHMRPEDMAAD